MKKRKFRDGGNVEDDEVSLEQTGGFGKAAVEEAAKRPTYRSTEGQVDERDRRQEAQAKMAKDRTSKAKAPIVTKEQIKKAGFDNLRDYLNAQKGLTRRGEKSKGPSSQDIDRLEAAATASRMRDEQTAYKQEKDAQAAAKRAKEMMADKKPTTPKREETGLEKYARILQEGKDRRAAARNELKRETRGMKKGGMVSASKRADGCAIRGKTRGKMV
jgi:hypothetical protein